MITFFQPILWMYVVLYFVVEHFGYASSSWWLIFGTSLWGFFIGIGLLEYLVSRWRLWKYTRSVINPEQSLEALTALLRIRCTEIGAIYHSVREYQKKAQDNAWIPLFMGEYRYLAGQGLYDEPNSKKEQKYLIKAHALYKKRFSHSPFFGTLEEPELIDTACAIHYWSAGFDLTIRLLKSIACEASLSRHVCTLLKEYRLIQFFSLGGNYHILFKNLRILSAFVRERYCNLQESWKEVISAHQTAIIITQASSLCQQTTSSLKDLLSENEALIAMESNLQRALSQENCNSHGWKWDWENEVSFFQSLKSNPIWTKFYGYDPYYEPEQEEQECDKST
jgi:hypothetical protein